MEIIRKYRINVDLGNLTNLALGDTIIFKMGKYGTQSATVVDVDTDFNMYTFIFDNCLTAHCMNENDSNIGEYDKSDLCRYIENDIRPQLPDEIKSKLEFIGIPTLKQIFGDEFITDHVIDDESRPFPRTRKDRRLRIADLHGHSSYYWLENATKEYYSSKAFMVVTPQGDFYSRNAKSSAGVRPIFCLHL